MRGIRPRDVFERDAYRCVVCGTWLDLTVDHIIPRARGGTNEFGNLQTLCRSCNSRKGTRIEKSQAHLIRLLLGFAGKFGDGTLHPPGQFSEADL
jgi:5-methylcytosine-specific restriction endonuclease McrA